MTGIGQFRIRWDEETGELERDGTITPKGSKVMAHDDAHVAVKIAGSHVHSGQGRPFIYRGARFELYPIICEDDDGWILVREASLKWPVRS